MIPAALAPALMLALLAAACEKAGAPAPPRVDVERVGPASVKLIPRPGQHPFCLVLTVAENGVVRQLTPLDPNESIACPAGAPIGAGTYALAIRPQDGAVRIHVVLSDRKLDGAPVAAQVRELGRDRRLTAMDLRAPGNVALETIELSAAPAPAK